MANKVYEFEDFEMVDDWHLDQPIVGWRLKGTENIFDIGEMMDMIKSSGGRWGYLDGGLASLLNKGGRVGYKEGNTVKKEFTEDDKKAYEMWLKDQQKRMEAAAKRHRKAMTFDALSGFIERAKRGIPPLEERTGFYGFANPDVLDVNLRKQIADDFFLQGRAQFSPNGSPYYSAKVSKTFKDGGRVGYKKGGTVKPKKNPIDYIVNYSDGTKLYKINSFIRDIVRQIA